MMKIIGPRRSVHHLAGLVESKLMWVERATVFLAGVAVILALVTVGLQAPPAHAASTFTVNRTGDGVDTDLSDDVCDANASVSGTQCTLRAALEEANDTPNSGGADLVKFNVPGEGVKTIKPTMILPSITDPVIIDGYTQPGAQQNTLAKGTNAKLMIELDGALVHDVLRILDGGTTIRGLVINDAGPSSPGQGVGILIGRAANADNDANNVIEGNFIGTNPEGTAAESNYGAGVQLLSGTTGNTIGGTTQAARNLISGNAFDGILVWSDSNAAISGNLIGTDKSATKDLGNGRAGIRIVGGNRSTISANTIAFNAQDGVAISSAIGSYGSGNRVGRNSIFANGGLGIDLGDDGPTPNDGAGDPDLGPNLLQNSPEIFAASTTASGQTWVWGQLDSTPNQSYTLRFFLNPPNTDEGETFIGGLAVTTDASGKVRFTFNPKNTITTGAITATATKDSTGDTSEFSAPTKVVS